MGRPHKFRKISNIKPKFTDYQPPEVDGEEISRIYLSLEEFEALRLRYYEDLKQVDAAEKMQISQTTYSRILNHAYKNITKALVEGFGIAIQTQVTPPYGRGFGRGQGRGRGMHQGNRRMDGTGPHGGPLPSHLPDIEAPSKPKVVFRGFGCLECGYNFQIDESETDEPSGKKKKVLCPECNSPKTYRLIKKLTPDA